MANPDKPKPTDSIDLMVQISDGHDLGWVADRLREAGVEVERELKRARIVGGRGSRDLLGRLEAIPGVKMVRAAETYQLPPFSEDIPQ